MAGFPEGSYLLQNKRSYKIIFSLCAQASRSPQIVHVPLHLLHAHMFVVYIAFIHAENA